MMNTIQDTIWEYETSADMIRGRIDALSEEICQQRSLSPATDVRELEGRRYQLYAELAHMESAVGEMRDYLTAVTKPGGVRSRYARQRKYG